MLSSSRFYGVLVFTIFIALLLSVLPLSGPLVYLRPELVCILVIYWITVAPQSVGTIYAFLIGITQDIVEGTVWGCHAMALSIVAYFCLLSYQRIANYSVWHQTVWVGVIIGVHQLVVGWIQGIAGYHPTPSQVLLSTIVSALFWPLAYLGLNRIRNFYRIS